MEYIYGLRVKTRSESWSFDPRGHMAKDFRVQEFRVRENWKCASLKTLEAPKLEQPK